MPGESEGSDRLEGVDAPPPKREATLVHTPPHRSVHPCFEYERVTTSRRVACLTVALRDSFDTVVDRWERHPGDRPPELAVITAEDSMRSAAAATASGFVELPAGVQTTSVSEIGDLTGIGIRIQQALDGWDEDGFEHVVVCFDSLTTLAQYVSFDRVFRFLHVLTARFSEAGVDSHFHIDPGAHDDRELATLRSLFDEVRSVAADER